VQDEPIGLRTSRDVQGKGTHHTAAIRRPLRPDGASRFAHIDHPHRSRAKSPGHSLGQAPVPVAQVRGSVQRPGAFALLLAVSLRSSRAPPRGDPMRLLLGLATAALLAGSSGTDAVESHESKKPDSQGEAASAESSEKDPENCVKVSGAMAKAIGAGEESGVGMRPGAIVAVKSPDFEEVYFIAMEFGTSGGRAGWSLGFELGEAGRRDSHVGGWVRPAIHGGLTPTAPMPRPAKQTRRWPPPRPAYNCEGSSASHSVTRS